MLVRESDRASLGSAGASPSHATLFALIFDIKPKGIEPSFQQHHPPRLLILLRPQLDKVDPAGDGLADFIASVPIGGAGSLSINPFHQSSEQGHHANFLKLLSPSQLFNQIYFRNVIP